MELAKHMNLIAAFWAFCYAFSQFGIALDKRSLGAAMACMFGLASCLLLVVGGMP